MSQGSNASSVTNAAYQPAVATVRPLTHRPRALRLDPAGGSAPRPGGSRSRSRRVSPSHPWFPTTSSNLAPALHNTSMSTQWRKSCGLCFCRRTIAFLQGARTLAYPTTGRFQIFPPTLALNPAFSVAPIESRRCGGLRYGGLQSCVCSYVRPPVYLKNKCSNLL